MPINYYPGAQTVYSNNYSTSRVADSSSKISTLDNLGVLVTRPEQQADKLSRLIETAGGRAIRFPTLEILPSDEINLATTQLTQLHCYDWIIFVSANAVRYAQAAINGRINNLDNIQVAAIGHATATALSDISIRVDLIPGPPGNSEALLTCPQMQTIDGQRFIIVRGEGGRALLGETLQQRGGSVIYAEVYKRSQPNVDTMALKQLWAQNNINLVTITSGETLQNLMTMLGNDALPLLNKTPIVVISQRLEKIARSMGLTHILLAENAADMSILKVINDFQLNNLK